MSASNRLKPLIEYLSLDGDLYGCDEYFDASHGTKGGSQSIQYLHEAA